jgi:hypothetical protein
MFTFGQKIHLGRALRIYGSETQHNLDYVRLIRNAFAHTHAPISFDTKEIKAAVGLLKPLKSIPPVALPVDPNSVEVALTSRGQFRKTCDVTAHNLFIWSMSTMREREIDPNELRPSITLFDEYVLRKPLV